MQGELHVMQKVDGRKRVEITLLIYDLVCTFPRTGQLMDWRALFLGSSMDIQYFLKLILGSLEVCKGQLLDEKLDSTPSTLWKALADWRHWRIENNEWRWLLKDNGPLYLPRSYRAETKANKLSICARLTHTPTRVTCASSNYGSQEYPSTVETHAAIPWKVNEVNMRRGKTTLDAWVVYI